MPAFFSEAAGAKDAGALAERRSRVVDVGVGERRDHGVELAVGKRERHGIGTHERLGNCTAPAPRSAATRSWSSETSVPETVQPASASSTIRRPPPQPTSRHRPGPGPSSRRTTAAGASPEKLATAGRSDQVSYQSARPSLARRAHRCRGLYRRPRATARTRAGDVVRVGLGDRLDPGLPQAGRLVTGPIETARRLRMPAPSSAAIRFATVEDDVNVTRSAASNFGCVDRLGHGAVGVKHRHLGPAAAHEPLGKDVAGDRGRGEERALGARRRRAPRGATRRAERSGTRSGDDPAGGQRVGRARADGGDAHAAQSAHVARRGRTRRRRWRGEHDHVVARPGRAGRTAAARCGSPAARPPRRRAPRAGRAARSPALAPASRRPCARTAAALEPREVAQPATSPMTMIAGGPARRRARRSSPACARTVRCSGRVPRGRRPPASSARGPRRSARRRSRRCARRPCRITSVPADARQRVPVELASRLGRVLVAGDDGERRRVPRCVTGMPA